MSESYYGRPILKPHEWKAFIPIYFWVGGAAGGCAIQVPLARLRADDRAAEAYKAAALAGALVAPALLIADLGVPSRFANMLRVFKPTSPMSVGSWILAGFGGAIVSSTLLGAFGERRLSRGLEWLAAALGAPLATYTSVLLADTAVPVWHEAYRDLPFVFIASGLAATAAVGASSSPRPRTTDALFLSASALAVPMLATRMERRLGSKIGEPYRLGKTRVLKEASSALCIAGGVISAFAGRESAGARIAAGCVGLGTLLERFAILSAGKRSAQDPKYVVEQQRDAAAAASPPGSRAPSAIGS